MTSFLLFLGTGSSLGVPVLGCSCNQCLSQNKKNIRLRTAALLQINNKKILIDVGPDFRQQALRFPVHPFQGVFFTHAHQDHIGGIDDLRPLIVRQTSPIHMLCSQETFQELHARFGYIFKDPTNRYLFTPNNPIYIAPKEGRYTFLDETLTLFSYCQSGIPVLGFRWKNFAYVSDIKEYDESIFTHLQGIEILVLSALKYLPSKAHLTIDDAINFAQKVQAKQTYFTHINHDVDYLQSKEYLPPNIALAYDGLKVPL